MKQKLTSLIPKQGKKQMWTRFMSLSQFIFCSIMHIQLQGVEKIKELF